MADLLANPYAVVLAGVLAAGALYYLFGGGLGKKSRSSYSVLLGNQPADSSKLIRNYRVGKGALIDQHGGHRTIYSAVQSAIQTNGNSKALGTRSHVKDHTEIKEVRGQKRSWVFPELGPYKWLSFNDFSKKIDTFGSAFLSLGLKPQENLAVYMETRAEWTLAAHAAFSQSIVVMTVYANLGEEALVHGLNQAECTHMATSGDLLASIAKLIKDLPNLKTIMYCDVNKADANAVETLKSAGVQLYNYDEVEEIGKKDLKPHNPPNPEDLAVLMYTSGSTGMPKGVMCTHGNCMASVGGVLQGVPLKFGDVHLSYLPLAHILAFVVETGCLSIGVSVAYGSPRTLSDTTVRNCKGDIAVAKPSFLVGVPTVYDKLKAGILSKVERSSGIAKFFFNQAYASKKAAISVGKDTPLWNTIVFSKFKAALGGNVRFVVSGGAPLSKECGEFLRVCFGVPVLQGYALTETVAGGTLGELDDLQAATNVGPPICAVEMKLTDCPEMGYTHNDPEPRGEIWIRGPNVSKGYYKNPEKTKEEFTEDGWFKTGDIGRLNRNGTIAIIDRKKNLIKPPHGEYIAVERLESSYKNCPFVANLMVYADSLHNELLALIFPNKPALEDWAEKNGIDLPWAKLCADKRARKAVLDALNVTWKETNLKSIERIANVELYPDEWTPENGWLTAALKVQRNQIQQSQKDVIERLFSELPQ